LEVLNLLESFFVDLVIAFGLPMLVVLFILDGALIGKFIPTDLVLPGAMVIFATASQDYLLILLLCATSSTFGQALLFYLVRREGDSAVREINWLKRIPDEKLETIEKRFDEKGGYAIIVSNLIPGIRGFMTIPAALDRMNFKTFVMCSFAGTFLFQLVIVSIAAGLVLIVP